MLGVLLRVVVFGRAKIPAGFNPWGCRLRPKVSVGV